jgi:hypothetical protein
LMKGFSILRVLLTFIHSRQERRIAVGLLLYFSRWPSIRCCLREGKLQFFPLSGFFFLDVHIMKKLPSVLSR